MTTAAFTSPKKALTEQITLLRYSRETAKSVVLPLLAGIIEVTLLHAAAKGVIDGTHEMPVWEGKGRHGRPAGWHYRGGAFVEVPGADVPGTVVVDAPRDANGHFQWDQKQAAMWDRKRVISRTGKYKQALLDAADDLARGNYTVLDSVTYGRGGSAHLNIGATTGGTGIALEIMGVWAALESATKNSPSGRHIIFQRLRNNRKALIRILQDMGNPWGLGKAQEKYAGWTPKPGSSNSGVKVDVSRYYGSPA